MRPNKFKVKRKFGSQTILDPKIFGPKKCWVQKILGSKIFGSNKLLGLKKFWVQKNFGLKKNCWSVQNLSSQKCIVKTNFVFCQKNANKLGWNWAKLRLMIVTGEYDCLPQVPPGWGG